MPTSANAAKRAARPGLILATVVGVLVSLAATSGPAGPATAAGTLDCSGTTFYGVVPAASGVPGSADLVSIDGSSVGGAQLSAAVESTTTIPGVLPNALGVAIGGTAAFQASDSGTIVQGYDAATGAWTVYSGKPAPGSTVTAGAVDPTTGIYYFGDVGAGQLWGFDTKTDQMISPNPLVTFVPNPGQLNGDIAFDGGGNLYIVTSSTTGGTLEAISAPLPQTSAQAGTLSPALLSTFAVPGGAAVNGIAFDGNGTLYLSQGGTNGVFSIDPGTGALDGNLTPLPAALTGPAGVGLVDLASCAFPPAVSAQKNVVARVNPTDQFALHVTGPSVSLPAAAVTTGTATGLQHDADGRVLQAGPALARYGDTYTASESAMGTTNLAQYVSTYTCVDTLNPGNPQFPITGSGTTVSFALATYAGESPSVICTFTNAPRAASLTLTKTASPATIAKTGDTVHYTYTVTNTGNTTLTGIGVTETAFTGTGTAPTPDCPTTTLAPAASVQCTATYDATAADIDAGTISNTAVADGQDAVAGAVTSPAATADVTADRSPSLTLDKKADPATITGAGQPITYSFVVTNTGNVTLTAVGITEQSFSGSGGPLTVTCPADATLAAGATLTCTADYRSTDADYASGSIRNTATADATDPAGAAVHSAESTAVVEAIHLAIVNPPAPNHPLAYTGSDVLTWLAPLAGLLALAGTGIAIIASRRRAARTKG
ncbi:DUF7507 domain-containing protein [Leifsonia shinshuensis]|uniref:Putative repeat protein (TIGR01451 family) n=1 Tax=Leifsonia shinshuensis TaxID=150026 RepID=A0A853CZQ9_9MICO|nr:DUF11 domain-containing protein [Leifsonia shinshuensis]NYJ24280.1 putative repeat protein (TIGR01451 family) [Leifsonia shinshuensis]